ncbi:MAG: hypothetical protein GF331_04115, partial [Chitinivibrionales bacterium]|nr:hypothetical protein [Chitinivibrionales bacterium]
MRIITMALCLQYAVVAYAQSVVSPVFVHKDGEASASGYTGSEKEIVVDGGANQVVGWITFQTDSIDLTQAVSTRLALYVRSLDAPGTLDVYPLTAAVTAPENNVSLSSLSMASDPAVSLSLSTADVESVVQLDITASVSAGPMYGLALMSDDGLRAAFDAREGTLAPVLLLTHDIAGAAAQWHSGSGAPAASLGSDGDYYVETLSGDVYARSGGAWSVIMNITGPMGPRGETGPAGPEGPRGPAGATAIARCVDRVTIAAVPHTQALTLTTNREAFSVGMQVRVIRDRLTANFFDGRIVSYDAANGDASIALAYAAGVDSTDSVWTVVPVGIPGYSPWHESGDAVSTDFRVGIGGQAGAEQLTVYGTVAIGGSGALAFSDGSEQTTAFDPSTVAGADDLSATEQHLRDSLACLRDSVNAFSARLAALEDLFMHFSRNGNDVYVTGANLHIRSGSGETDGALNGRGNLIVGYNEERKSGSDRSGSHNLVVGRLHDYSSHSGMVVGYNSTISGVGACVSGGIANRATASYASVSGGRSNAADGAYASVSGGYRDTARGSYA